MNKVSMEQREAIVREALAKRDAIVAGEAAPRCVATDMIDAAMIAMKDIVPPLRRSDCQKLIHAALSVIPAPTARDLTAWEIQQANAEWLNGSDTFAEFWAGAVYGIRKFREVNRLGDSMAPAQDTAELAPQQADPAALPVEAERDAPVESHLAHARYEYVRKLSPRQFTELWTRNINGEGAFDDLVDAAIDAAMVVNNGD
jgi:hypothetical protein